MALGVIYSKGSALCSAAPLGLVKLRGQSKGHPQLTPSTETERDRGQALVLSLPLKAPIHLILVVSQKKNSHETPTKRKMVKPKTFSPFTFIRIKQFYYYILGYTIYIYFSKAHA